MTARLLIVNADDYALTEGTSRAILQAHQAGVVTSTSVLAVGQAFARSGPWLREHSRLGVGVHLALVGEEPPLSPPRLIRSLVDRDGRFPLGWRQLLARSLGRPLDAGQLAREFSAQIERVKQLGVEVSHLDCHQHLQLLPGIREVVLKLARRFGIGVVRVPRSQGGRRWGTAVNWLSRSLRARARAEGLRFTDDCFGFDQAGTLDQPTLLRTLAAAAGAGARSIELVTHPGPAVDPQRQRYRWPYRWGDELDALLSARTRDTIRGLGFRLASPGALVDGGEERAA